MTGTPRVDERSTQIANGKNKEDGQPGQPAAERLYDAAKDQAIKLDDRRRIAEDLESPAPEEGPGPGDSGDRLYNQVPKPLPLSLCVCVAPCGRCCPRRILGKSEIRILLIKGIEMKGRD